MNTDSWREYCMLCCTHCGDNGGLLGGYCSRCWQQSVFAEGAERIECPEPVAVQHGETPHDAITRAIRDGVAKVIYKSA